MQFIKYTHIRIQGTHAHTRTHHRTEDALKKKTQTYLDDEETDTTSLAGPYDRRDELFNSVRNGDVQDEAMISVDGGGGEGSTAAESTMVIASADHVSIKIRLAGDRRA